MDTRFGYFSLLSLLLVTHCSVSQAELVNSNVDRTVDLSSHLPKITNLITVENIGKSAVNSYIYIVDSNLQDSLSFIGAVSKNSDEDQRLKVTLTTQQKKEVYRIDFESPLASGKSTKIEVETYFPHTLQPYPSEIAQSEKQLVKFITNAYYYSIYDTAKQTTVVNTVSSNIESYTQGVKPVSKSENSVTYGPFEDIKASSEAQITIHYENNTPFLSVTEMDRLIEVSHWGNIAVEETIDVRHTGALLKGSFSRYDYQRNQDGQASIKSFKTNLPAAARDVYYRDEIGNISTSNLKEMDEALEVELRPRFPLFGGWKTHYTLGYNVPSYQYLYNSGDKYVLKMRFVDHIYDDQIVDYATVRVILPEGANVQKLVTPFDVKRSPDQKHFTYLDTTGRPVIIAHKSNLVDAHIQDFELHYTFSKTNMFIEPLLAVSAFYLLFVVVIIYVRLDFSITKDEATESRLRVAGLVEQIQGAHDRRSALYQSYDDAINKFKSSKDTAGFIAKRKAIDADHKSLTGQISGLLSKLKAEGADAGDKVAELQNLDSHVREQVNLAITYAEKLIQGKINKQQYLDVEATVKTKKEELYSKMEGILASL
jgi:oligosaccharyltransferase complex subunit alpha (ribophorin I)